jgi:hypothetical protein
MLNLVLTDVGTLCATVRFVGLRRFVLQSRAALC